MELVTLDLPTLPLVGLPYGWGRDFASILENYRNMAGMIINGEDMPRAENRITLNRDVKDTFGLPVANVHVDEHPNDQAMRNHAQTQMSRMYEAIEAKRGVVGPTPPATHNTCSARMSADRRENRPRTQSVPDERDGRRPSVHRGRCRPKGFGERDGPKRPATNDVCGAGPGCICLFDITERHFIWTRRGF